jgi:hemoglobin-like flavoprotein
MTTVQIELVQSSFEAVKPIAEVAADLFYTRLFELDPSLRAMFRTDRAEQGRKLMHVIGVAVKGLSRPEQILPAVEDLGRRHACYGVRRSHYATVGAALLWTLEKGLGEAFTPDVRAAWTSVYTLLADTMKRAAACAITQDLTDMRATASVYP